jgi:hypothetical protein
MTDPPKNRRGGPVDPLAIAALVLGAVAFIRPGVDYLPGVAVGIVCGILAVLLGIAGVTGARGRVPMVVISVVGIILGFVGAAIALVGALRIAS